MARKTTAKVASLGKIKVEPLTAQAFAPFGEVIELPSPRKGGRTVNQGRGKQYSYLADILNFRPGRAAGNLSLFHIQPSHYPVPVDILERHIFSSQLFVPLEGSQYLVVVAAGDGQPERKSLRAFCGQRPQGINYRPGVWHLPLVAIDEPALFACYTFESHDREDTIVTDFNPPVHAAP